MKSRPFKPSPSSNHASKGEHLDDGKVYLYWDPKVEVAVNVALATLRPLLVRGAPGTGKSTLARNVSVQLDRTFESVVVTSRTMVTDLLWEIDLIDRLARAQAGEDVSDLASFIRPGPFWRALTQDTPEIVKQQDVDTHLEVSAEQHAATHDNGAVLLIDEIDKADPDLPNALLEPMVARRFPIPALGCEIACSRPPPLVVFTTNGYRELSRPFLRRCIEVVLETPTPTRLAEIAGLHFGGKSADLHLALAHKVGSTRSIAEYLDAVHACEALGIGLNDREFEWLLAASVIKPGAGDL